MASSSIRREARSAFAGPSTASLFWAAQVSAWSAAPGTVDLSGAACSAGWTDVDGIGRSHGAGTAAFPAVLVQLELQFRACTPPVLAVPGAAVVKPRLLPLVGSASRGSLLELSLALWPALDEGAAVVAVEEVEQFGRYDDEHALPTE